MEEAEFCRNLRGVNAGQDFPRPFLSAIYHSICSGTKDGSSRQGLARWIWPGRGEYGGVSACVCVCMGGL
jgi:Sec7 domain